MSPIEQLADYFSPLLQQPMILKVRRNHGLEHATIHILNRQRYKLSGRSSATGFILLGEVPTAQVEGAVHEALQRMKAGEHKLALHPNCGTNLVTAGFLATTAAFLGFAGRGWRKSWERFPTMMALLMGLILLSTPLGLSLQRHFTTEGDLGDMELVSVTRETVNLPLNGQQLTMHRVVTAQA
ncbi:MAG: DUF6391 domain-containing protein [Chloroflexi bacterium]|nr:DUF6391 domain-containing protein [Chloroflexota bacterium]